MTWTEAAEQIVRTGRAPGEELVNKTGIRIRIKMSFIARYVYTYEEFVFMTEATAAQQNDSDRTKNG